MPVSVHNPYSGKDEDTCSVSFEAQQKLAGSVGSPQTEANYHKSKMLGEWGVITAKFEKGEIPNGTKLLTYEWPKGQVRGYLYVKGGDLYKRTYFTDSGEQTDTLIHPHSGESLIKTSLYQTAIPQAVAAKPKPEPVFITSSDATGIDPDKLADKEIVAVSAAGDEYIAFNKTFNVFEQFEKTEYGHVVKKSDPYAEELITNSWTWVQPDKKESTPKTAAKTVTPTSKVESQVAAPIATPPVNSGSSSVGSMSNEDVAAMFVKIKDDVAKQLGVNIKGANVELDAVVHKAIANKTGYTTAEVYAKIAQYKAQGNKLSALKKKVMAGTVKVPEGKPQPSKAETKSPATPLSHPQAKPEPDPKPNGVPTVATPKVTKEVKQEVVSEVKAEPAKVYSDEDIAAQYIMRKDQIVGESNGKWTLYTKDDALEYTIYQAIFEKTGLSEFKAKAKLAAYLGSGKKLSVLKKQLIKQGAFTPKADTLKSKPSQTSAEKAADVNAKAEAGYTPTSTPATGSPPVDTGKAAPKAVQQNDAKLGDISDIPDSVKKLYYSKFKGKGSGSYLSSSEGQIYNALASVQQEMQFFSHSKDLTLLQLIRVIDEQGAIKFKADNAFLFEKKVATWLTSPAGTKHIKDQEAVLAAQAQKAKDAAEAEEKAKELEANQPALPADSARYRAFNEGEMDRMHAAMQRERPWTPGQRSALTKYTGSAYHQMNSHLRSGGDLGSDRSIKNAQEGMRPSTEDMLVHRGTGISQFGIDNEAQIWGLTGKTMQDKGFMSTSFGGRAAFGGQVLLEIEVPKGSQLAYAKPISRYSSENEVILAAGTKYKVLRVSREGFKYVVRVRVVQ